MNNNGGHFQNPLSKQIWKKYKPHEVHRTAHHWPLNGVWILISLFMQPNHWILITNQLELHYTIYIFFYRLICHRLAQISFNVSKLGLYTDKYKALKLLRINATVNQRDFKNSTTPNLLLLLSFHSSPLFPNI